MPLVEVGYDDPNKEEEVMSDLLKLAADTREAGSPEGTLRPCDRRSEAAVLLREPPTMRPNGMMGWKESCDFLRAISPQGDSFSEYRICNTYSQQQSVEPPIPTRIASDARNKRVQPLGRRCDRARVHLVSFRYLRQKPLHFWS